MPQRPCGGKRGGVGSTRFHDRWAPGLVGDIAALHARFYARSHGFGAAFERKVAAEFGALLAGFDPRRDLLRAAEGDGRFPGSTAVDGAGWPDAAQLRFFILDPALHGRGLGRRWLAEAVAHARVAGFRRMFLWTLGGLGAATALYEEAGFRLEEESVAAQFGAPALERRFGLAL
ncbi:GNAT family N-acetyltransferase [Craurococcus roseus]|uniref:GNAT family N-acetyltransferase n=1 Tax=Craurococcus roseus TaxID=77585 RepID=A0ABP3PVM0_9PROT